MSNKAPRLCRIDPEYRPCEACELPKTCNVTYAFVGRRPCDVRCLCEDCDRLGFVLLPDGEVVRERELMVLGIAA